MAPEAPEEKERKDIKIMEDNKIVANEENQSYTVTRFFELFQSLSQDKKEKVLCFISGMVAASGSAEK